MEKYKKKETERVNKGVNKNNETQEGSILESCLDKNAETLSLEI